jgi:hypothetical protein
MSNESPEYYQMNSYQDVFDWLATQPAPDLPLKTLLGAYSIYSTGFRYARRCLWKGKSALEMAQDARKASECFSRLATLLAISAISEEQP